VVFQFDQLRQLVRIQLTHTTRYVVIEQKAQEFLLPVVMAMEDRIPV
jgi:hypothetical protein